MNPSLYGKCWHKCHNLNLFQDPGDETQPKNPTPSDLHEETNVKEVLADHSQEADLHPEEPGEAAPHEEQNQEEPQEGQEGQVRQRPTENEVSEVDIPNVGRITVRADADGYNEEVSPRSPSVGSVLSLSPFLTTVSFNRWC